MTVNFKGQWGELAFPHELMDANEALPLLSVQCPNRHRCLMKQLYTIRACIALTWPAKQQTLYGTTGQLYVFHGVRHKAAGDITKCSSTFIFWMTLRLLSYGKRHSICPFPVMAVGARRAFQAIVSTYRYISLPAKTPVNYDTYGFDLCGNELFCDKCPTVHFSLSILKLCFLYAEEAVVWQTPTAWMACERVCPHRLFSECFVLCSRWHVWALSRSR